jgi:hypothetical protein
MYRLKVQGSINQYYYYEKICTEAALTRAHAFYLINLTPIINHFNYEHQKNLHHYLCACH